MSTTSFIIPLIVITLAHDLSPGSSAVTVIGVYTLGKHHPTCIPRPNEEDTRMNLAVWAAQEAWDDLVSKGATAKSRNHKKDLDLVFKNAFNGRRTQTQSPNKRNYPTNMPYNPPTIQEFTSLVDSDFEAVFTAFPNTPFARRSLATFKTTIVSAKNLRTHANQLDHYAGDVFADMQMRGLGPEILRLIYSRRPLGCQENPIIIDDANEEEDNTPTPSPTPPPHR
ncbi:hypothetical protein GALMADRAFT_142505 [Galerina marginata CBS 339.88]|uniref:Retrotransposon gag domain-containing protein n=1 Tax=Galerina marginata (strain CBS 339.88) TaxID=685588 RepID=A0A067SP93_GALM3|nr:hypothetical protein GALMADRAFT_142505 [Galerina marginata CBS 339.88]